MQSSPLSITPLVFLWDKKLFSVTAFHRFFSATYPAVGLFKPYLLPFHGFLFDLVKFFSPLKSFQCHSSGVWPVKRSAQTTPKGSV